MLRAAGAKNLKKTYRIDIYKSCGKKLDCICNILIVPIISTLKLLFQLQVFAKNVSMYT